MKIWFEANFYKSATTVLIVTACLCYLFGKYTGFYYKNALYDKELQYSLPLTLSDIEVEGKHAWYETDDSYNQTTINKGLTGSIITVEENGSYLQWTKNNENSCRLNTTIIQLHIPGIERYLMEQMKAV